MDKIYFFAPEKYLIKTELGLILKSIGDISSVPTYLKFNCELWFHNNILIKNHSNNNLIVNNTYSDEYINQIK